MDSGRGKWNLVSRFFRKTMRVVLVQISRSTMVFLGSESIGNSSSFWCFVNSVSFKFLSCVLHLLKAVDYGEGSDVFNVHYFFSQSIILF